MFLKACSDTDAPLAPLRAPTGRGRRAGWSPILYSDGWTDGGQLSAKPPGASRLGRLFYRLPLPKYHIVLSFHAMDRRPFMATRDRPRSERALIDAFAADLRGVLPAGWSIAASGEQALGRMRADAVIDLTAPGGQSAQVLVEAKTTLAPRAVASAVDQLRAMGALLPGGEYTPLVLSRFLSPRVRQMLSDQGVSWADATGNLSLAVKRPAVFVQRQGAAVDPWAERTPVRSLRGRGAAATVRALCDFAPPYTVSELATRARLPLASVYRTVDFLATEALLEKQSQRGRSP